MADLKVNAKRLWASLEEMARIGPGAAGGSRRLALTDEDKAGRDRFVAWAREAGCAVAVDEVGNIFARRDGSAGDASPVLAGSHLDTQPTGGRYDGVYGVLSALEVIRTLNDAGRRTRRPVEAVVWTNEEGSRFQPAMNGSGVFAGALELAATYAATDGAGLRFADELARIGYRGDLPARPRPIHAYLEAHIEQGPILEAEGREIGIVTGIQGIKWFKLGLRGFNAHAGTTPMEVRRDPLLGASRMVDAIDRTARAFRPDAVATVGMFAVSPGSINVINERVDFSLDLRCPADAALLELERRVRAACGDVAGTMGLALDFAEIWFSPATAFAEPVVGAVERSARALGHSARRIVSGAGHDAKYLAEICPTGMIFIPCRDGVSHNEAERIEPAQAEAGANVLLRTVLELAEQG
jgi:beta-ureidopropionase / N-carbamoyl-L-amino-acid hydrolase